MPNYKLLAVELGERLKDDTTTNAIERIAKAIFPFDRASHPNRAITSSKAQLIYDWVITLEAQPLGNSEKQHLFNTLIEKLAPETSGAKKGFSFVGHGFSRDKRLTWREGL